ncbi:dihydrolipoyl dehydrogenase [Cytobacillus depressus]|uniref:Dihydrolipoyl dehydrogenase n=1 Tax=Cytobacillus depressus TaxID=1602942 RepID=A0A6L3V289_9BACI|nr:dihydrolipoyl dehydrogenase [Cytobacillus depressus]KAB2332276.1 dihydrolipoyl dehydrogenase [Cytobacillus depressus]
MGDNLHSTDTIVIGAGPGGYVAAIRAAQLGQKVTIVEKENLGGVCLNVGCIPSKALITAGHHYHQAQNLDVFGLSVPKVEVDFSKVQAFKESVVNKLTAGVGMLLKGNKVEIVKGTATFVDANTVKINSVEGEKNIHFKHAIIATGSRPFELPTMKFSNRIIDSTGALNLKGIPKSLLVVGGGVIGVELVGAYANFGVNVTILEGQSDILIGIDNKATSIVKRNLKKKGVDIYTKAFVEGAKETDNGVEVTCEINGEKRIFEADYLLVSVGRKPNTDKIGLTEAGVEIDEKGLIKTDNQCRTSIPHIYAIGDIISGPQLAHKASYEGKVAAEAIAGEKAIVDYTCIPAVVFSEPEIAVVGHSEESAKKAGIDTKVSKFPFAANGRAIALNQIEGFVQLVTRADNDMVIGGQIIGPNASDMIAEITLAIETGLTAEDLALTIHAHPTLGEIVMETAELALGNPIHIVK